MSVRASQTSPIRDETPFAILALVGGAVAMGISPIFVRFADVGPFASALWRVALALPVLWLWARLDERAAPGGSASPETAARHGGIVSVVLAGLLFAGDLTFWHLSILHTSVANATFLAVLAPVWVVLGSGMFLGETVERRLVAGLALCLLGAAALIGGSLAFRPDQVLGDLYGLVTSFFFGAYFIAMRRARRAYGTGRAIFASTLVTAAVLAAEALAVEPQILPASAGGLAAVLALALVSQAGGQGLLAYALGHLPAAFSSLVMFIEALAGAFFGWAILSEAVGPLQFAGAAAIFAGIAIARPRRAA
ncbi:DMT family transporter [Propylenella binzhouense]|uniref:DMT family transporter n=1 Tax=Propylenella binzhouense TaxID=2555902 RepID=A0A964T4W7_9HYPH|nr:DMT family transporter [Propylenella binzhouense]MYZ48508.1 DMT family transporter [Propylenella binzhouense]